MASISTNHFRKLFKEDSGAHISSMMDLIAFFPSSVNNEKNKALKLGVSLEELKVAIHSMKVDKSPRTDDLPIECFLGFMDLFEGDLLMVIKESCVWGQHSWDV